MKKLLPTLMLLVLTTGCPSTTPKPVGPTPVVRDTDVCGDAGKNIEKLQCRDRRGDPMWVNRNGEKFEETCRTAQEEGGIFLDPKCIAEATTCEQVLACPPSAETEE